MRELEKITLNGVRYIVWDELRGTCPQADGIALLLSARNGVGADALLVIPENRPLAVRAYAKDGHEIDVDENARSAASLALEKLTMLSAGAKNSESASAVDRIEVRLTDAFCRRLFHDGKSARIAG